MVALAKDKLHLCSSPDNYHSYLSDKLMTNSDELYNDTCMLPVTVQHKQT